VRLFIGVDDEVCSKGRRDGADDEVYNKGRRDAEEDHKKLAHDGDSTRVEMNCRTLR
jgi:hypothetical protein